MSLIDEVRWFPGGPRLLAEARAEMPQKHEECGAFVALVSLRANGIGASDQDEVAKVAGSSAFGLARAVETFSGGGLRAVPACGEWTADALSPVLQGVYELASVAVVANVDTGQLGAQDTPERALLDYLDGGLPPLWTSRWQVGHFVILGGMLAREGGTLVSVVDSYPSLGDRGVHLQMIERVAAALRGLLLVVPAASAAAASHLVLSAGLRPDFWDR